MSAPGSPSSGGAWPRAGIAWASFVVATALVTAVFAGAEASPVVVATRAAVVLVVVGAALVFLHRRDGGWRRALAVGRAGSALVGLGVVGGAAAVVFGVDALAGGTRVTSVAPGTLLGFVVLTVLVAGAQEAVPEELALRGSAYGSLAATLPRWGAAVVVTAGFVAAPGAGITLGRWLRGDGGLRLAPDGQDPVVYLVLLAFFGTMLVVARIVTGSVLTCIAAHLVFLLVNRVLVVGDTAATGVAVDLPDGGELLVPVYLVLATLAFALVGRLRSPSRPRPARPGRP